MKNLREAIVVAAASAGEGHIPSALSILDILWVLYDKVLKIDPLHPTKPDRDRFVLSKGQGALGLYVVLAAKGFFQHKDLDTFATFNSILGGHPDRNKIPGVEASTGSLGHGFPIAVGMAMGLRVQRSSSRVFTLIGDGEANEGSVWESALLAAHHKLSNLCCIIDYNHSTDRALLVGNIAAKFGAFDWECISVNGHDQNELLAALTRERTNRPLAIVARTVKGFGCARMENNPEWHHKAPTPEQLPALLESLR
jgi:transketolase